MKETNSIKTLIGNGFEISRAIGCSGRFRVYHETKSFSADGVMCIHEPGYGNYLFLAKETASKLINKIKLEDVDTSEYGLGICKEEELAK